MTIEPYAVLGAGELVSLIWKADDEQIGGTYRFNVYRNTPYTGHVSQLFRPTDVQDLVKLCGALAAALASDDGIPPEQRRRFHDLTVKLDCITRTEI